MPPAKGQRQARGVARQQQILATAFELFASHGYRSTTLAMVAERVGLTEAGVLHHFSSKDALLAAVLQARDNPNPDAEAFAAEPGGGLGSLRRFPVFAKTLLDNPLLMRFDAVVGGESLAEDGPAFEHFRTRMRLIRLGLARMLASGVRRGEFRSDIDVDAVAAQIVAFMDGIQHQWLLDPSAIDLEAAYQLYADLLERSLAPSRRARTRAN